MAHSTSLLKEAQVIGVCTVDLSGEQQLPSMDLQCWSLSWQGYGSYLAKSVVNQLIEQNDKAFQIASRR